MTSDPIIVNVISLGCAKNLVDTEVMCGVMVSSGIYLSESLDDANVCLINTCCFIRDARNEAEESIRKAIQWKRKANGRKRVVVVAGCLAQRQPEETKKKFPDIDLLLGLDDVPKAAQLIVDACNDIREHQVAHRLPTYLYDHNTPRLTVTPTSYSFLKIAEGCDHRCAFCAIPLFRGNQRSRDIQSIITEVKLLLKQGSKEINLIAQDSSRYGLDRQDGANIVSLLRECDKLDGDFWIRILYTHPLHVSDELLDVLAHSKHIVPYLDMPIQHVATDVLQNMRRGMTGPQLKERLRFIRNTFPELTVRTTVLVGFPGETEEDFQELLDFVGEFKFDRLGAFAYSPEEGTPAVKLDLPVPPEKVALQRQKLILEKQAQVSLTVNQAQIGKTMTVLMEEQLDASHWLARSTGDAPDVDQTVVVKVRRQHRSHHNSQEPRFAKVKITGASQYDLSAEEL